MNLNFLNNGLKRSTSPALFSMSLIFISLFFLMACEKHVAGPKGDPGAPGRPGNLKLTLINELKVLSTTWVLTGNNEWVSTHFVSDVTRDVIEQGEVNVYLKTDSLSWGLPYCKGFVCTQYSIEKDLIHLRCSSIHGGTPSRPLDANYKIVIFSPS